MASPDSRPQPPPIALGTVQLGMPYGLGAARDGIDEPAALAILDEAWRRGIRCLDTARAYGHAEARIGRWLGARAPVPTPFVVSKFPALADGEAPGAILRALEASRRELRLGRIDLYLAHRGTDLLRPGVVAALQDCVAAGTIGAFGASAYDPADARSLIDVPGLGALQLPIHLANTAAVESGVLDEAARRGIAIFARSVFLQGLLLQDARTLDGFIAKASAALARLENLAREAGTTRAALAIAAVRKLPAVSTLVFGVDSAAQLAETLAAYAADVDPGAVRAALEVGKTFPPELADPRRWKR